MIAVNGQPTTSAVLSFPSRGEWTAAVVLGEDVKMSGVVAITYDGGAMSGAVIRGDVTPDGASYFIVGGKGQTRLAVPPKSWRTGATVAQVLSYLATSSGEAIATTLGPTALGQWSIKGDSLAQALDELCDQIGATWIVRDTGAIFVGLPTYVAALQTDPILSDVPSMSRMTIGAEKPNLRPLSTFAGKQITFVQHTIAGSGLRTIAYYRTDASGDASARDPVRDAIARIARNDQSRDFYSRKHMGKIVAQSGYRCDILPEDFADAPGVSGASMAFPPGYQATIDPTRSATNRGRLSWDMGDPSKPYVDAFEASAREIILCEGTHAAARTGDAVDCGALFFTSTGTFAGYASGSLTEIEKTALGAAYIAAGGVRVNMTGKITGGSTKVKIG